MNYATDTDKIKIMQLTAGLYRMYIKETPRIIPIIQKFDGKQANIRINRAFDNEFDNDNIRATYSVSYNTFKINLYANNHTVFGEPDQNGFKNCFYADNRNETISVSLTDGNKPENGAIINGRINATAIIQAINGMITYWTQEADEIEKCIEQAAEIKQRYNDICAEISQFKNSINYQYRSMFKYDFERIY